MDASCDAARAQMLAVLPRMRRFALALTGNLPDADDLVQDTVERALTSLDKWTPGTRMDSWMFKIAQNLWIDTLRSRKRKNNLDVRDANGLPLSFDGERAIAARLNFSRMREALAELPEDQRAIVALIVLDGFSYREAASILDIPIGTVTSRLARARAALAEMIFGDSAEGGSNDAFA